jgi:N-acetylneuraminate synthase
MQCTAQYPAPLESLNLSAIPSIKSRYGVDVGLSDHSMDPIIAPLVAIGYGATVIEKHFTLDRNLPGPDHAFAIVPEELKLMVETIRKAGKTKGDGEKKILPQEQELKQFATRSIQATKDIAKGEILIEGQNFDVLRPGNRIRGIEARFLEKINNKRSSVDVKKGDGIIDYY